MRWLWFFICAVFGLAMLVGGLLVPMHLRAVDAGVIEKGRPERPRVAGAGTDAGGRTEIGRGANAHAGGALAGISRLGPAGETITNLARQNPAALAWGDDGRVEKSFCRTSSPRRRTKSAVHRFHCPRRKTVTRRWRICAIRRCRRSRNCCAARSLNNTVLFPPSSSASGQAFDAAVCICGLLLDGNRLPAGLSRDIFNAGVAGQSRRRFRTAGAGADGFHVAGRAVQLGPTDGVCRGNSRRRHAAPARGRGPQRRNDKLPVLFAAVQLSGKPAAVADYLAKFKETGLSDLGASLRYGAGGVGELAKRQQRFYNPPFERRVAAFNPFGAIYYFAADVGFQKPRLALAAKWLLYLLAGFFLAAALHFARPAVSALERPLQVRGFHLVREFLFSLGFLLVVLLLSEPFLAQESQKGGFSLRLLPPMAGGAVPAGIAGIKQTVMNPIILLTLLVFFVLQALIYISCLVKLAEIRRQNVPPRMKLKLLENEDHLFDAGLYLGFVGTIVSLIIASMGLVKFSLMAAYSSTSFGIIFVVIFKIFHLRPARRKLLLEAEAGSAPTPIMSRRRPRQPPPVVMNRSILIVICDFLLLSLLTFSTDINHMADENTPPADESRRRDQRPSRIAGNDLAAVMKQALEEERQNQRTIAAATRARAAAQQQTQLSQREQENLQLAATVRRRADEHRKPEPAIAKQFRAGASKSWRRPQAEAQRQAEQADGAAAAAGTAREDEPARPDREAATGQPAPIGRGAGARAAERATLLQQEVQAAAG